MTGVACIVEGHGECEAVPILIRRIGETLDPPVVPTIKPPLRVARSKLLKKGELERAVEFSARSVGKQGAIFLIIDADDDGPAILGPQLHLRAKETRADMPIGVVLAKREYEAWFLASAESLRGRRGLPPDLSPPEDPESIRAAKEWLGRS